MTIYRCWLSCPSPSFGGRLSDSASRRLNAKNGLVGPIESHWGGGADEEENWMRFGGWRDLRL